MLANQDLQKLREIQAQISSRMLSELFEEILDSEKSFKEKVDRLRARGWAPSVGVNAHSLQHVCTLRVCTRSNRRC